MILSLRIIKKPRKERRCDECGRYMTGEHIRLYGMADYGDKPGGSFFHRECINKWSEVNKMIAELEMKK